MCARVAGSERGMPPPAADVRLNQCCVALARTGRTALLPGGLCPRSGKASQEDGDASVEARLAQQVLPVGAGDLLEHGLGELPDLGWQGYVEVRGGVGLAGVGEPVEHVDQFLPCGSGLGWWV